jgi:activator of 2-hydroxyglutaryl-CoA dehydratase
MCNIRSVLLSLLTAVVVAGCAASGGGAKDLGLVRTIAAELGVEILVPEEPQITAALGAALMASRQVSSRAT